ncbi:AAA family ATPase [Butyrivibrio sp. FCS014]|uniref:AAA family ATPase n=1 Tax=Butyrivibrio sp. FCS014 TaxID=1408304 RepID=UPI000466AFD9|nr:AAA family ATPase [Butyrivibrio sp. FCS014]
MSTPYNYLAEAFKVASEKQQIQGTVTSNPLMVIYSYVILCKEQPTNQSLNQVRELTRLFGLRTSAIERSLPRYFKKYENAEGKEPLFTSIKPDYEISDRDIFALACIRSINYLHTDLFITSEGKGNLNHLVKTEEKLIEQMNDVINHELLKGLDETDDLYEDCDEDPEEQEEESIEAFAASYFRSETLGDIAAKMAGFKTELSNTIVGQDRCIAKLLEGLFKLVYTDGVETKNGPRGVFFFAGPPGVGKTLMAFKIGELFPEYRYEKFDMADYSAETDFFQFTGTDQSYRQAHEGLLARAIKKNPKNIFVFDEIEKAGSKVQNALLGILSAGQFMDDFLKREISCRECIFIFTSNAGKKLYENRNIRLSSVTESVLMSAISQETKTNSENNTVPVISAPFLSRIMTGTVLMFDYIEEDALAGIADRFMKKSCEILERKSDLKFEYDEILPLLFLFHYTDKIDARIASSKAPDFIMKEFFEIVRQYGNMSELFDEAKKVRLSVDIPKDEALRKFFVPSEPQKFVFVCRDEIAKLLPKKSDVFEIVKENPDISDEIADSEVAAFFIDPYLGVHESDHEAVGLEDSDSDGVDLIYRILDSNINVPVYLINYNGNISPTDQDSFITLGCKGTLEIEKKGDKLSNGMEKLARGLYMKKKCRELNRRGYIIDFDTMVEKVKDEIVVTYYDIRKKQAIDEMTGHRAISDDERPNTKLEDVIGAKTAKEELQYYLEYLKQPVKFMKKGGRIPKGILLYGPPGTGKTMLARAMAGESDCSYFQINATELFESAVGAGEDSVRELFARARKYAPSIIFIDEIDTIGKTRTGSGASEYCHGLLTTLLTEMDGFSARKEPVFVLAATNYGVTERDTMNLDPALLRRFDNRIYVGLPEKADRQKFLESVRDKKGYTAISDEAIKNVAGRTVGQTIATLESIVDLMHRKSVMTGAVVDDDLFIESLDEYDHGAEKERSSEYYEKTSIHESGHAYMAYLNHEKPTFVTIVSRADYGGYMQREIDEQKGAMSRDEILGRIRTALAGRAAEMEFYGEDACDTGASSDLANATSYAMSIVTTYGMIKGQMLSFRSDALSSIKMPREYVQMANDIILEQFELCKKQVHEGRSKIEELAGALREKNYLTKADIEEIIKK